MADASTKSILRVNLLLINALKHSKAEHVGQVKPLESAVEDVVADLHESGGSFNKLLMAKSSATSNPSDGTAVISKLSIEICQNKSRSYLVSQWGEEGATQVTQQSVLFSPMFAVCLQTI
jgi:hypothetical protein